MLNRLPAILIAFTVGIVFAYAVLNAAPPSASWASYAFSDDAYEVDPALSIPPLSALIGDATTNADALAAVAAYYDANAETLAALFAEDNEQRTRALFGMYLVHVAVPYNRVERDPVTLIDFVNAETAHCGTFARAQSQVYTALGLRWRNIVVDDGWHGLVEAEIDGRWETFDATNNLWLSVSVEELIAGAPRSWRTFYTPHTDAHAPDTYRAHLADDYNMQLTRMAGTQWGLSVFPARWVIYAESVL